MNSANNHYILDPRLEIESIHLGSLHLCQALFKNDSRFPWLVLVPQRPAITEILDLAAVDRMVLIEEITLASKTMQKVFNPNKLNVAALGNVVPQLHIHVIARYHHDDAWPNPVWGNWPALPYPPEKLTQILSTLRESLALHS